MKYVISSDMCQTKHVLRWALSMEAGLYTGFRIRIVRDVLPAVLEGGRIVICIRDNRTHNNIISKNIIASGYHGSHIWGRGRST